jgi:acetyl-CoA decarbonylase/synthase complex subunit delta
MDLEVATATACLVGGSNAVMLRHPESVAVLNELIAGLVG